MENLQVNTVFNWFIFYSWNVRLYFWKDTQVKKKRMRVKFNIGPFWFFFGRSNVQMNELS